MVVVVVGDVRMLKFFERVESSALWRGHSSGTKRAHLDEGPLLRSPMFASGFGIITYFACSGGVVEAVVGHQQGE